MLRGGRSVPRLRVCKAGAMTQFRGKFTNRLDGKGRVSVPASFRPALNGALVLRRSMRHGCVEAWPVGSFDSQHLQAAPMDELTPEDDLLAYAMYSDTLELALDPEGRIVLPREYRDFAGIGDQIAFLGRPGYFELWEPAAAEAMIERAREVYAARARGRAEAAAKSGNGVP